MDRDYESQNTRMKKQYDRKLREELMKLTVELKEQFQDEKETISNDTELKLSVKLDRMTQKFLTEKVKYMQDNGEKQRNDLANLLESQAKLSAANRKLEEALTASKKQIEELSQQPEKTKWFIP